MPLRAPGRLTAHAMLIVASSFVVVPAVRAQSSVGADSLAAGTRVRVYTGRTNVVQGEILRMTADSIAFRENLSRGKVALALPQVSALERSLGHPGIRAGAAKMAVIGGVLGAIVGFDLSDFNSCTDAVCRPSRVGMTLGVGTLFAAVGALTVGVLTPERWETVFDRRTR